MQASTLHAEREEYHEIKAGLGRASKRRIVDVGTVLATAPFVTILGQSGATAPDIRLPLFPGPPRQSC